METFSFSGEKKTHIHVFIGGKSGVQQRSFMVALSALLGKRPKSSIQVVFMDASELRAKHLTPATFVDWLLVADVYFILSHPHQSIRHWNCRDIAQQFSRLSERCGFPSGQSILCSIVLQDKCIYLHSLRDYCNPTSRISIPLNPDTRDVDMASIAIIPTEDEGSLVVKTPFTTNCENFKIVHSVEQVLGLPVVVALRSIFFTMCSLSG